MEKKSLSTNLNEILKSREAFVKSVSVKDVRDLIAELLAESQGTAQELTTVLPEISNALKQYLSNPSGFASLAMIPGDDIRLDPQQALRGTHDKKKHAAALLYLDFINRLGGDALAKEKAQPFSGLLATLERFIAMLKELDSSVESFFAGQEISLFNSRLSHVVILAVINETAIVNRFTSLAMTSVIKEATENEEATKYRTDYMATRLATVASIVDRIVNGRAIDIKVAMNEMKSKGLDVTLVSSVGEVSDLVDQTVSGTSQEIRGFTEWLDINPLAIFRWMGEKLETWKHDAHQRRVRRVEWMKARVALFKLRIAGKGKDDPEYIKFSDIIEKYEYMIDADDRKIKQYELA